VCSVSMTWASASMMGRWLRMEFLLLRVIMPCGPDASATF
jgi:hypothetical protein